MITYYAYILGYKCLKLNHTNLKKTNHSLNVHIHRYTQIHNFCHNHYIKEIQFFLCVIFDQSKYEKLKLQSHIEDVPTGANFSIKNFYSLIKLLLLVQVQFLR